MDVAQCCPVHPQSFVIFERHEIIDGSSTRTFFVRPTVALFAAPIYLYLELIVQVHRLKKLVCR